MSSVVELFLTKLARGYTSQSSKDFSEFVYWYYYLLGRHGNIDKEAPS
jgi:hypothetical protein